MFIPDRFDALHRLLRNAPRDRLVAPIGQPFAFATHHGKIRKDNQDTALVLAGQRMSTPERYLAAVLCDGMGGLEAGDEAADLAAARVGATLVYDDRLPPVERMDRAIRDANAAVFARFRGRAGTVLVAALLEQGQVVLGWVGDARAYGVGKGHDPELLTRDDTVAAEVARIDGAAQDAMNALLAAVGQKPDLEPHVRSLQPGPRTLLLVSDGVHRIEAAALAWVCRHAPNSRELVDRLRLAADWEGGIDNATALALQLGEQPSLDSADQMLAAWVENQPCSWEMVTTTKNIRSLSSQPPAAPIHADQNEQPVPATTPTQQRQRKPAAHEDRPRPPRARPEQVPLSIELGDVPGDKP